MRHLLLNAYAHKSRIWNACVRCIASESVIQSVEGPDRSSTLGQRWQQHENQILIAGVEKQELELEKAGKMSYELTRRERWEEIETFCLVNGINRNAEQCRQRWERLLHAFSKIKNWESCRPPEKASFWSMKNSEKKAEGLPFSFDLETFNALDGIQHKRGLSCSTTDFSDAEAVSTESPSCKVSTEHPLMEERDMQGCTQATTISITNSDQEVHASNLDSSTTLVESAPQINPTQNDDRPVVLVNAIHECLNYLKVFEQPSGEQVDDVGNSADTAPTKMP